MSFPDHALSASATLVVGPQLTIGQAVALKSEWLHALGAVDALTLDLSGVEEVDLGGVQLLLLLQREAARAGKSLHLSPISDALRKLFILLRIFPDVAERRRNALGAFR